MSAFKSKWMSLGNGTDETDKSRSVSSVSGSSIGAEGISSRTSAQSMANRDCGGGGGERNSGFTLGNGTAKTDRSPVPSHPSTANPLLHAYRRRGFTLRRDGDALVVRPADRLTDSDVAELQAHKPALLALRACPVLGCGQLLPWGEAASHDCGKARHDISVTPTSKELPDAA